MRWYENYRINWIRNTLRKQGYINRKDLMEKFGMSTVSAANDLKKFRELYPGKMKYNQSTKRYEPLD